MNNDLENRCLVFAKRTRNFLMGLKKDVINVEYIKQLVRSSASVGANYIEANEKLGEQDLKMKIKISRREAKESKYWLNLVLTDNSEKQEKEKMILLQEAEELRLIFSAILNKLH
jgi:four helix bundle protein